jgi:hypothetical protein
MFILKLLKVQSLYIKILAKKKTRKYLIFRIYCDGFFHARQRNNTPPHNPYRTISFLLAIILLIVSIITKFQYIWLFKSFMVVLLIFYFYCTIVFLQIGRLFMLNFLNG